MSGLSKDELSTRARALGFDVCRVALCTPPAHADAFRQWLELGCAGEMTWLDRNKERRTDPQLVLPGTRSVVVLGMSYFTPGTRTAEAGRIARYAWGNDYHPIIEGKLRELDAILAGHGGVQKCYVDTGPILERDIAAQAGAGWHGKSTMLINRQLGTWFFLAEILTTLAIEPDAPEPDRCGKCTRCLDACPTGALTSAHQLDARRCISYLTIELKGSIPTELRPLLGDRIYGCDDCLDACPWNRFAQVSRESAFAAREATAGMSLADYLALTDEQFRTLFRHSPIKRIKRRGFLRNVCVALGNVGTPRDLPSLEHAANDPEPLIAEHAQWALERIRERSGLVRSKP
ncbi:MAG: epoxyqueuosine reductase [Chthoniobacter sp.]|jgi:epoxyqueuosine reductase|nr:epoxyqueuosine reductase [Chthoniobacter sp.]